MGRQPCCDKVGLKKGPWTVEEDKKLINFILTNGQCCWRALPKLSGRFSLFISSLNDIFWDFSCVKVHFLASCVFSLSLHQLMLFFGCYFSTPTKLMLLFRISYFKSFTSLKRPILLLVIYISLLSSCQQFL